MLGWLKPEKRRNIRQDRETDARFAADLEAIIETSAFAGFA